MPPPTEGQIDVWRANLDGPIRDRAELLSADEHARAARFHFEADRERWINGRAILRLLLGPYLEVDPQGIRLEPNANGKPAVPGSQIAFNLSHSGEETLYAFARVPTVGIDVELLGRRVDALSVAGRVLGPGEAMRLRHVPPGALQREFLRSWVRYEAALKCRGGRLGDRVAYTGLSLFDLDVGPAAVAAVAASRRVDGVRLREFRTTERSAPLLGRVSHGLGRQPPPRPLTV